MILHILGWNVYFVLFFAYFLLYFKLCSLDVFLFLIFIYFNFWIFDFDKWYISEILFSKQLWKKHSLTLLFSGLSFISSNTTEYRIEKPLKWYSYNFPCFSVFFRSLLIIKLTFLNFINLQIPTRIEVQKWKMLSIFFWHTSCSMIIFKIYPSFFFGGLRGTASYRWAKNHFRNEWRKIEQ